MNKIIKKSACMLLATTLSVATYLTASAVATSKWKNTGNSVKYGKSIDLSLKSYKKTIYLASDCGSSSILKTNHEAKVDDDEASLKPNNNKTEYNLVYWYAEWKEDDGKGKIRDKIEVWMSIPNKKLYKRGLSDGMKFWTWDRDITYCRFDICPLWSPKDFNKKGEWDPPYYRQTSINKSDFYTFKNHCQRRASTDITH